MFTYAKSNMADNGELLTVLKRFLNAVAVRKSLINTIIGRLALTRKPALTCQRWGLGMCYDKSECTICTFPFAIDCTPSILQ